MIEVRSQRELEAALARTSNGNAELIVCAGGAHYTLRGNSTATLRGNSTATLWGNSTATLRGNSTATLWGNSTATLWGNSTATLWGNSTATLWGNSTATLRGNSTATLRGNSTATLWGNSTATLRGNSTATLRGNAAARAFDWTTVESKSPSAVLLSHSDEVNVVGDPRQLAMQNPQSVAEWLEFYGIEVEDGVAILYKAVGRNYHSRNGIHYTPGSEPVAPDWDGGVRECGGGLHFSPHPQFALDFRPDAEHFLACPVKVEDIAFHPNGNYPQKVKARGLCGPAVEVNGDGEAI